MNYGRTNDSYLVYPDLVAAGVKILVFSGNVDAAVPFTDTLRWIEMLDFDIDEPWR